MSMHVIGTAGHVDHGKSALVERLTGTDPDRLAEEKRRGLTIDLGFAALELPSGAHAGIVDVPGHERFIKNMLAGAGGVTICLLVIAANESWKPQTLEHLSIIDLLGIHTGVVALSKSDTADEDAIARLTAETEGRLAGTSLEGAPIVPCSARMGAGIDDLLAALDTAIASSDGAPDYGRPRLWIDRVFTIAGAGTVVTGTLADGALTKGEEVEIFPSSTLARVRNIQSHNSDLAEVGPGNRVALNLSGVSRDAARRGDAVVRPKQWFVTRTIDVRLSVQKESISGSQEALTEKGAHLLYVGSAETPVRVKLIEADSIAPGQSGLAQLRLRDPLPLGRGDRFILRDAGRVLTLGGGIVLDPAASSAAVKDHRRAAYLHSIDDAEPEQALRMLVSHFGQVDVAEAKLRTGATRVPDEVISLGGILVSTERLSALQLLLKDALAHHHDTHPLERGLPMEDARRTVQLDLEPFAGLIEITDGLEQVGARLRLAGHEQMLSPLEVEIHSELMRRVGDARFTPPMETELGASPTLLRALVERGDLVKIGGFFLTQENATEARTLVRDAIETEGPRTVAQIRDLLGTTRRYAVPLCEWLDATGATLRQGDVRILGPVA
jgi:selenocysteine-specific elongation factor